MNHKVTVRVLIADGTPDSQGDRMTPDSVEFERFIPVTKEFLNGKIGQAKLFWEGHMLCADITLFGELLKTVNLEPMLIQFMTPAVGGSKKTVVNGEIIDCVINQIALCASKNADNRIKTVGEQVNEIKAAAMAGKPIC